MTSIDKKRRLLTLGALFVSACGGGGGGEEPAAGPSPSPTPSPSPPPPPPSGSTPPLITGFVPNAAAVGQQVRIEGGGFVASVAGNTVRFNGVSATVLAASTTAIDVLVPAGATSGTIQVSTSGGTHTSSASFTVMADTGTPGIAWTTRRMGAPTGALAYGAGKFVSAGGDIRSSTDLLIWTDRVGIANADDVAWDGRQFVAVGGSFTVSTSPDGLAWTPRSLPAGVESLRAVVGSGTRWVAVGDSGSIASSADGIAWSDHGLNSGGFTALKQVIWTGTQFVAAGESGRLVTSPDGISWTLRNVGTTDAFVGLGSLGSLIVASAFPNSGSQQAHYTSPDGVTWTRRGAGTAPILFDIKVVGNVWVGGGSYAMYHSTDGISWTQSASRIESIVERVAHDGSKFVAVGSTANRSEAYTSVDGQNWTRVNPGERSWTGIARSPAGLMVSPALERLQVSSNGIDWSYGALPATGGVEPIIDVVWYPALDRFVALGQVGANQRVSTSTDGLNWTTGVNVPYNGGLGASPTLLVNIANSVSGNVYTSPDAVTWTPRAIPATSVVTNAVWVGDRWVAVGLSGTLMTSPDGLSWTLRTSGTTQALRCAVAGNGLIVVVGTGGTVLTSADGGVNWVARTAVTSFPLNDVVWTGAEFVAVGGAGRVVRSTNGIDWTAPATPYTQTLFGTEPFNLRGAVWTGSRIVVVGERDLVATSP